MLNVIEIKDFNAPELDIYARCTEARLLNKDHPEEGMFIAESPKVIERALDAGCVPMSFLMEKKHVETQAKEILARCEKLQSRDLTQKSLVYREDEHEIPVYVAEIEVLAKITGYQLTRGMLCAMYDNYLEQNKSAIEKKKIQGQISQFLQILDKMTACQ